MKIHRIAALVATLGLLSACGGEGQTEPASDGNTSFSAYKAALSSAAAPAPAASTPAAAAESVQRHGREWAVSRLMGSHAISVTGTFFTGNEVVLPPLHFARVQMTAAGAHGETLQQMAQALPAAADAALARALARGVSRAVSAGAQTRFTEGFMRALTAIDHPGTWASVQLHELSEAELLATPRLRLSVQDTLNVTTAWPLATAFEGVFGDGAWRRLAPMLRVSGAGFDLAPGDAAVAGLRLAGGRWLLRIEPTGSIQAFTAAQLDAALALATARAAAAPAEPVRLVLPDGAGFNAVGLNDLRGMALAFDPKLADLRALDGSGGLYASTGSGSAALGIGIAGLELRGQLGTQFVFNPENIHAGSGWSSSGSVTTRVELPPVWPADCGSTDLRPAYLALIDERGALQMLARWTAVSGRPCW